MNILIVGSGAAGGLIGARLIEQKCDVTFLVRPERKAQLMTTGLVLYSHFGKFRRPVSAITLDELKGFYDLIIVAVRATDYESVLQSITPSIGSQTAVLPVIEGAGHLQVDLIQNGGRLFAGLLEARVSVDADGCLHQRLPVAELTIGAADPSDTDETHRLAGLLKGRGLVTCASDRVQDRIWERYCFAAAAIAVNALTGLSVRDAIHPTHRATILDRLITEGVSVGKAIGLSPDPTRARRYRESFRREGRPVQPPALVTDPGHGGCESAYLLLEMCCIADRAKVGVPLLRAARQALLSPCDITLTAKHVSDDEVAA